MPTRRPTARYRVPGGPAGDSGPEPGAGGTQRPDDRHTCGHGPGGQPWHCLVTLCPLIQAEIADPPGHDGTCRDEQRQVGHEGPAPAPGGADAGGVDGSDQGRHDPHARSSRQAQPPPGVGQAGDHDPHGRCRERPGGRNSTAPQDLPEDVDLDVRSEGSDDDAGHQQSGQHRHQPSGTPAGEHGPAQGHREEGGDLGRSRHQSIGVTGAHLGGQQRQDRLVEVDLHARQQLDDEYRQRQMPRP